MYGHSVGQSDAAATWAGDIGAGVADAVLCNDNEYEHRNPGQSEPARLAHYYRTRAPEADLLGDIDAWGVVDDVQNSTNNSLTALVNNYYGASATQPQEFQNRRCAAVTRFMQQYKLKLESGTVVSNNNRSILENHIRAFADIWYRYRKTLRTLFFGTPTADMDRVTRDMASRFLTWLDNLARSVGAL